MLAALEDAAYDFVMAAGDDSTDEDMFQALPKEAATIRVGIRRRLLNTWCRASGILLYSWQNCLKQADVIAIREVKIIGGYMKLGKVVMTGKPRRMPIDGFANIVK